MTPFPITPEWLREMADAEDNVCVSVGGLPYRANALPAEAEPDARPRIGEGVVPDQRAPRDEIDRTLVK